MAQPPCPGAGEGELPDACSGARAPGVSPSLGVTACGVWNYLETPSLCPPEGKITFIFHPSGCEDICYDNKVLSNVDIHTGLGHKLLQCSCYCSSQRQPFRE